MAVKCLHGDHPGTSQIGDLLQMSFHSSNVTSLNVFLKTPNKKDPGVCH